MAIAVVVLTAAACQGDIEQPACDPESINVVPDAPSVVSPEADRRDVVGAELVITTSAFTDPDAVDTHAGTEIEIWRATNGARVSRVWRAVLSPPSSLTSVTLADGAYEGGVTELSEWSDYIVRARYRDSSAACDPWSEWGPELGFRTDDGSRHWFDPDRVHTVYIDIPPDSWDAIDAEAVPPGCVPYDRNYYAGTLRFEGQVFPGVGVRVKGGCGSARNLNGKAGFKINLSWDDPAVEGCPAERRLYGLKRLTLNNLVQDPTFSHERLGYPLYKQLGVPTPRTAHIVVYVNDELWGLYNHVETIDRRFLERWFDSNAGDMYEGTYWCDLVPANVPPDLDDTYCLRRSFGVGECSGDGDYQPLRDLVAALAALPAGGFYPEIEQFFDFDTFLSSWAVDTVISHWDAYEFSIINNYRVYRDPLTARWTLIPHGIDQTFMDTIDGFSPSGLLAQRCLQEADCEAAYAARVHAAVDAFESLGLVDEALAIDALIRDHVVADPRKEVGIGQYDDLIAEMRAWITERPGVVREELAARGF